MSKWNDEDNSGFETECSKMTARDKNLNLNKEKLKKIQESNSGESLTIKWIK